MDEEIGIREGRVTHLVWRADILDWMELSVNLHWSEREKERFVDRIDWVAVEKMDELKRKLDFELIMKIG